MCDGRKGLLQLFTGIPVQMCQFHQSEIIRRYLTKSPKLQPAKELMEIANLMKKTDKESFIGALGLWFDKWALFLKERTVHHETGKSFYTHKNLRSAYRSLKTNLPWLFTWRHRLFFILIFVHYTGKSHLAVESSQDKNFISTFAVS